MQLTVWGDQSGHELFIVLTDAGGEQHLLATRTILDWEGPRRITLDLDPLRHPPPKLVVTCDHWGGDGNQVLDDPVTAVTIGIHDRPDDREGRGRVRVADLAFIESGGR